MNQNQAICTIIAKNYLAFARTLTESFLNFHPEHKCYVLVVDEFEGFIDPADERFEIIRLTDLGIPNLPSFCFKYDIKELCTAAKAHFLEYLIREKSVDRLLYADPDILITGRLDSLFERLRDEDIVLTPHLDKDYPNDDRMPNDGHILRAGIFNLGFIGVNSSQNSRDFLEWWKTKLYDHCVVDLLKGYFVDQKFVDLVPHFFRNVFVERDVGYNVAYWNLHSRRLSRNNGAWMCNEGPLYFFHFSGYAPESAAISSHILSHLSRYRLSNRPDIRPLFAEYKDLLIKNGHLEAKKWAYTFGYFKTGEAIPDHLRLYYRNSPEKWRRYGDPFASESLQSLVREHHPDVEPAPRGPTAQMQLDAILRSRAWRWVSHYGRFKKRFLTPAADFLNDLFRPKRKVSKGPSETDWPTQDVDGMSSERRAEP